jgi:4-alpha-glucanotransferase
MNKPWLKSRGAGLLLHVTALPSEFGIGNLGSSSRDWMDLLNSCGMSNWQICPIGPTGFGNSPYSTLSAFAGNPLLIDFSALEAHGLLRSSEIKSSKPSPDGHVAFLDIEETNADLLRSAFHSFTDSNSDEIPDYGSFIEFKQKQSYWLDDYCLYRAFKTSFNESPWYTWEPQFRDIELARKQSLSQQARHYVQFHAFQQYLFDGQWKLLIKDAKSRGIQIIGDSPIFVSHDSADTWSNPNIFALKADGQVEFRAGVPPDYFSTTGQLWGNPVYRWDVLKENGYSWWIKRLQRDLSRYSALRLDHFRAFHDFWSIPESATDACTGIWENGPGLPFFDELRRHVPAPHIIAEDLGEMIPEVYELRDAAGFPGMKVLQFAFCGDPKNPHLPHNFDTANSVVFPGTHDNNTSVGWYEGAPESVRDNYRRYLSVDGRTPSWDFIRTASGSPARLALYPVQDILNLGSDARFNTPGVPEGNWTWRCTNEQVERIYNEGADYLKEITRMHGRLPETTESPQ